MSHAALKILTWPNRSTREYRVIGFKSIPYLTLPEYCTPRGIDTARLRATISDWPAGIYTDLFVAACVDASNPPPWKMPKADKDWSIEQKRTLWREQARVKNARILLKKFELYRAAGPQVPDVPRQRKRGHDETMAARSLKILKERQVSLGAKEY